MKENKKKGFTLIEIIIAIFIIGLIITLANFSINKIKETGRDIKRIDNIKQIQLALEMYRRDIGSYPETLTFGGRLINPSDSNIIYLNEIPTNLPYKNNNNCSNEEFIYSIEDNFYLIDFCLESPTENYALGNNCAKTEGIYDGRCSFFCGESDIYYAEKYYPTIKIGNQCWLQKNLDIGTMILGTNNPSDNGEIEKYCQNDDENNCNIYGGLYQWNEAMEYSNAESSRGICPPNWHIPSKTELNELILYLGGTDIAGGKMKEVGNDHWLTPNEFNSNNESLFTALPAGYRYTGPTFGGFLSDNYIWSSSENDFSNASYMALAGGNENAPIYANTKLFGFSIRCLKD